MCPGAWRQSSRTPERRWGWAATPIVQYRATATTCSSEGVPPISTWIARILSRNALLVVLALLIVTFTLLLPHTFPTAFNFRLLSIDPSPPSRGNNTWVVEIDAMMDDVVGAPVDGLCTDGCPSPDEAVTVTPWMPDHQHGSPIIVDTTPSETSGQYELDPINLWMPGVWTTTIAVTQGSAFDKGVYTFCLSE